MVLEKYDSKDNKEWIASYQVIVSGKSLSLDPTESKIYTVTISSPIIVLLFKPIIIE